MTKANVIQLGILLFSFGLIFYAIFIFVGFDDFNAGIASETLLILILFGWVFSYFYRVISGKMTFMEQRKRYLAKYEQITEREIKERYDALSEDEKENLLIEIDESNN